MPTIAENIKRIRKEKGLTQKQLGDLCVPPMADSAIRRYETGKANPKTETLSRIALALGVPLCDLDFNYSYFEKDRSETLVLISQLQRFIDIIPNMNAPEEVKQKTVKKVNELLEKSQQTISMIDAAISKDQTIKQLLDENESTRKDIEKAEQDIDNMFLFVLHQLNFEGQEKAIMYATDLTKIPEYQKDDSDQLAVNAAHERTDVEVTDEMRKHDDDLMKDDNF